MTQVFLVATGAGSFADPGNWNPANNIVECLGAGAIGAAGGAVTVAGGGGGGAAYGKGINVNLAFPVLYYVAAAATTANTCTSFGRNTPTWSVPTSGVSAMSGAPASTSTGGASPTGFYPSGFAGGAGGNGQTGVNYCPGGGGGGAAGPHGAGAAGSTGSGANYGLGGAGDNGATAAPPSGAGHDSANGTNGAQWDASHGSGSGANAGYYYGATGLGGVGGVYGGGGGGGCANGYAAGAGYQGIIVLTNTPPSPGAVAIIMG